MVVSSGEAFVIFCPGIEPAELATLELGPDGLVTTESGGTRVLFDDGPVPMTFATAAQISGFAPFSLAGKECFRGPSASRSSRRPRLFAVAQPGGGRGQPGDRFGVSQWQSRTG